MVVYSMDRLARNLDDLRCLVQKLAQRGVRIEFVKESLTFTGEDSPMANLMLSAMGAFADYAKPVIMRSRARSTSSLNMTASPAMAGRSAQGGRNPPWRNGPSSVLSDVAGRYRRPPGMHPDGASS